MDNLQYVILAFPIFLFSLVFHEFAHALAGHRLGDDTARLLGRLTLNPAPHVDPLGTIAFPLVGMFMGGMIFGWARPVPFSPHRLRHPLRDAAIIAGAGPASNVVLALLAALALRPVHLAAAASASPLLDALATMLMITVQLNVLLAWFNLLPIPPLDGSKVLAFFLPPSWRDSMWSAQSMGPMPLLLFLLIPGLSRVLLGPVGVITDVLTGLALRGV